MNESVRSFITRLLNMPVSRSRGPYNPEDWGLWSELVRPPHSFCRMHRAQRTHNTHTTQVLTGHRSVGRISLTI